MAFSSWKVTLLPRRVGLSDRLSYTPGDMSIDGVSLVIPGRNCAATLRECLAAVVPMLSDFRLREIIFVDDGSTDDTPQVAREFPITYIRGEGRGAGAARNLGWRAARTPLVWFVDSDCVAEPDALSRLLPHLDDPKVAGVGGSYGIMTGHSLLACLIHEEIVQRHQSMGSRVNFLATFNVVYRRSALEEVGGFDERFLKGQDAELSWRVLEAGHELAFDIGSRVKHYHPVSWPAYLQTQSQQGYWRVWLYLKHRGHAAGDSYSGLTDHLQPPLAMLTLAALPLLLWPATWWLPAIMLLLLLVFQMPMTWKIVRRTRRPAYAGFAIMSVVRAFWRGAGMTAAVLMFLITGRRGGGSGSARSTGQVGRETDASRDQK